LKVEALIVGNLNNKEAEELVNNVTLLTKSKPIQKNDEIPIVHMILEQGFIFFLSLRMLFDFLKIEKKTFGQHKFEK
jgi:hypothetical protein